MKKQKEDINGVIYYRPKQKIIEDKWYTFDNTFLNNIKKLIGFIPSLKYGDKFIRFQDQFTLTYPRSGKIVNDNTIEFNSFDNFFYDASQKGMKHINLDLNKYKTEEFMFRNADNNEISCLKIYQPILSNKWVIGCHGWTENKYLALRLTDQFLALGYNVLTFDSIAHGMSYGEITDVGFSTVNELNQLINMLKVEMNAEEIGLIGNSMGGALVAFWAGKFSKVNPINWVIADCGFSSIVEQYRYVVQYRNNVVWWVGTNSMIKYYKRKYNADLCDFNITKSLKDCVVPILFAHGTGDLFVPVFMSKKMHNAVLNNNNNCRTQLYTPIGVDHCRIVGDKQEEYYQIIKDFIKK